MIYINEGLTIKSNGFIENNNYKLIYANNGTAVMEAEITESSVNPFNVAHGGFIFGLADTTAGAASRSLGSNSMTVNASIEYLHAIAGKKIKAEAKCIKNGQNISVFEVLIYDLDREDRIAAKSTITYCSVNYRINN